MKGYILQHTVTNIDGTNTEQTMLCTSKKQVYERLLNFFDKQPEWMSYSNVCKHLNKLNVALDELLFSSLQQQNDVITYDETKTIRITYVLSNQLTMLVNLNDIKTQTIWVK